MILTHVLKDSPGCYSENRLYKDKSGNREAERIQARDNDPGVDLQGVTCEGDKKRWICLGF